MQIYAPFFLQATVIDDYRGLCSMNFWEMKDTIGKVHRKAQASQVNAYMRVLGEVVTMVFDTSSIVEKP